MPVEIDIEHVAKLARLQLTDEEKASSRPSSGRSWSTPRGSARSRPPTSCRRRRRSRARTCTARTIAEPSLPVDEALRNAPEREGDRFRVPRIAETGA